MAIQIIPSEIEGCDGMDVMFRLRMIDEPSVAELEILSYVTADTWPSISHAIQQGLEMMRKAPAVGRDCETWNKEAIDGKQDNI